MAMLLRKASPIASGSVTDHPSDDRAVVGVRMSMASATTAPQIQDVRALGIRGKP
jgi:hypothetical protein